MKELKDEARELLHSFREAYKARAEAEGSYDLLELKTKTVRAMAMKQAEADGNTSVASQEREAELSPLVQEHYQTLAQAKADLWVARGRYVERETAMRLWQTIQARDRAEIEMNRSDTAP